jgi:hypothetical protein
MRINLQAPINGLGYGIAGDNLTRTLLEEGHEVALFCIPSKGAWRHDPEVPEWKHEALACAEKNADLYDPLAPSVRVWSQTDLAHRIGRGVHVGFPFFELTRFTEAEKHHLLECDRIFVASKWAKQVLLDQRWLNPTDVKVVPLGVDRIIFHEGVRTGQNILEHDHTIFVNVGKWEIRKGHDVLLEAFSKAFTPRDKVVLKIAAQNPFIGNLNEYWASRYATTLGSRFMPIGRLTDQTSVAKLLAGADCGVFPARAEGWNLDLLETLSVGTHAIATNYSAHTEYLNSDNCRLINTTEFETARDGIFFKGQGEWAKFGDDQMEQLINHLREVHRLKQTGQLQRNVAGIETAKQFSWQNTANAFIQGLA